MLRRQFLQHSALAAAAAAPREDDEDAWRRFRQEHFLLPDWRAFLNTGSVGSPPRRVVDAVNNYLSLGASYATDQYPRWGYEPMVEHRAALARFFGCATEELALTHNATESMSLIANGLDLKAGDEVLITDQEHPSGRGCWLLKQARTGIRVRETPIPVPPKNAAEIRDAILGAIRPETRVLSFSGITTHTGLLLPVKEICAAARAKGVITVVDGAHMPGQVDFRLSDLGCDVFAASLHKWLLTPPGCGLLYVRQDFQSKLWPTIVVDGWQNTKDALKYMQLGCNNRAELEGVLEALRFIEELGATRIYARIHHLARYTYEQATRFSYLKMLTSPDHNLYGGMVAFEVDRPDYAPLWKELGERKVWTLRGNKIRISTHIHTRKSDIDKFFQTLKEVFG
jgi:selenocysteine lyase/cysteine desulfurase